MLARRTGRTRAAAPAAAALVAVIALASCSTRPATEVIVFVDAEPGVRAATAGLEVRVEGSSGRGGAANFAQRELSTLASPRWPVRIALSPLDGDGQRVYRVTATALDGAMPTPALVAQVRVVSGYRPGESVRIDLLLQDACLRHAACPSDQTCVAGNCAAAMIDPATLARLDTDASRTDAATLIDGGPDTRVPTDGAIDGGVSRATEEATLVASDGAAHDNFGWSVALTSDGSRALVGVWGDVTVGGVSTGSARVFLRAGATWTEEATLLASDRASGDSFGWSVALSADGSRALVGSLGMGNAHIFLRSGATWTEEARLVPSGVAAAEFGRAVALSSDGSRALVGWPYDGAHAMNAGSARVFVRAGTTWTEEATLFAAAGGANDNLGGSVSLSGDGSRALVGSVAIGARMFLRVGTTWTEEARLTTTGWARSVALSSDGTRACVAVGGVGSGVFTFLRAGTTWTEEATLAATDTGPPSDYPGSSLALNSDGSVALVGADAVSGTPPSAGSALVFRRTGTTWAEDTRLRASDGAAGDRFGVSVAVTADGSRALVGAGRHAAAAGLDVGDAKVFFLSGH